MKKNYKDFSFIIIITINAHLNNNKVIIIITYNLREMRSFIPTVCYNNKLKKYKNNQKIQSELVFFIIQTVECRAYRE